jgi:ABC-type lipoprotein release transport system permease subunit
MNFPYQFFIAFRYFRSKKKHGGISINTFISIAGVALGVTTLLTVLSVMSGFHEDLQGKILGANAHVIVQNYEGRIKEYQSVREKINGIEVLSVLPLSSMDRSCCVLAAGRPELLSGVLTLELRGTRQTSSINSRQAISTA